MGSFPSKPEGEELERLQLSADESCRAAGECRCSARPMHNSHVRLDPPPPGAAVAEADILLVVTGAGFSADSGLAVYNDIAKIKPYAARGLDYQDLCQPHHLDKEPALFHGFWGACFNDYRKTQPHRGYEIIARWRDRVNESKAAGEIRKTAMSMRSRIRTAAGTFQEREVDEVLAGMEPAGAFFLFTSNVDAHSFDHFKSNELREVHGNIETWQCAQSQDCTAGGREKLWRIPVGYSFNVDRSILSDSKNYYSMSILMLPE